MDMIDLPIGQIIELIICNYTPQEIAEMFVNVVMERNQLALQNDKLQCELSLKWEQINMLIEQNKLLIESR